MGKTLKVIDSVKESKIAKMLRGEINEGKGCKVNKTRRK